MNAKANTVLDNIRKTLEASLQIPDLQEGETETETELSEAEVRFCEEGLSFVQNSKYELEGFEECSPEDVIEALEAVAEDDPELAPAIEELFKKHNVVAVEG